MRVLDELDEAVERAEAKGLEVEVEARRLEVDKGLKEVLMKLEGCKRKERELKEAREAMTVEQRDLVEFKERSGEEVAQKEALVRELKSKMERAEKRHAGLVEQVVNAEVMVAEKESC